MTKQEKFSYAVIGLGKTGLSAARFLTQYKISFFIMDSRENPPDKYLFEKQFPDIPAYFGEFNFHHLKKAQQLILSPGIDPRIFTPHISHKKITSDIELFGQYAKAPIIGITGTNAKGTVTTLLGEMLAQAGKSVLLGGNIGTPALDLLSQNNHIPDYYILELSSFQLEITHYLKLKAAVILNISPDHLDRHGTLDNYIKAKQNIYRQTEYAVFNRDDEHTRPIYPVKFISDFGLTPYNQNRDKPSSSFLKQFGILFNKKLAHENMPLIDTGELKLQGKHNWINALAALALGDAIGLSYPQMVNALKNFSGLPHRCEWIMEKDHTNWYNDSKGTNIGATIAALSGLGGTLKDKAKIILILGGIGKNQDFSLLKASVLQYTRAIILMGQDAQLIYQSLSGKFKNSSVYLPPFHFASSLDAVVQMASQQALKNDIVLFSPACASFDMFKNFEDRGDQFKLTALKLLGHV